MAAHYAGGAHFGCAHRLGRARRLANQTVFRTAMKTLAETLLCPTRKDAVVADCVRLIEGRVEALSGVRGITLKAGLSLLKGSRPGLLPRATEHLLPDFVHALEPLHARYRAAATGEFA